MVNKYFTNNLEQTARNLISGTKRDVPGDITGQLEQEIELTLEQLRKLEEQEPHETISNSFSQPECSVGMGMELVQTNQYTPQYVNNSAYSYNQQPICNKVQRPYAMEIKQKMEPVVHKDHVQRLQQKLFSLLEKHKQNVRKTRKYWTGITTEPTSWLLM